MAADERRLPWVTVWLESNAESIVAVRRVAQVAESISRAERQSKTDDSNLDLCYSL